MEPKKPSKNLAKFEEDLINAVANIKFKKRRFNNFQRKLREDVKKIRNSSKVIVQADKTSNLYELTKDEYTQLLNNNITATYKTCKDDTVDAINEEARDIAEELGLSNRIRALPLRTAFITLKDHKPNFKTKPTCRLLNPTKSEIGLISKKIIEKINKQIRQSTNLIQWTNTDQVISWFEKLDHGKQQFLKFDVKDFYPSISKKLIGKALKFARKYTTISKREEKIIYNATKSVLFHDDKVWSKRSCPADDELFDITMGGFHGAEVCELVGLYMLDGLTKLIPGGNVGIYRDDGLAAIPKQAGTKTERLKKKIHAFARGIGLQFEIDVPSPKIDYLDIVLDLDKNTFAPYRKPGNVIKYINCQSNHPKTITSKMKGMIEGMISRRSSNKDVFDEAAGVYEEALKSNGYEGNINYQSAAPQKKTRKRKRIWFNPPFCQSVKGCIGKTFIALVKKHFHAGNPLHKIINIHKVGFSYSCMPNMQSIIASHNRKILNNNNTAATTAPCNCTKFECPIKEGSCRERNVVYQATVKSGKDERKYTGLASEFKNRYYQHRHSFNNRERRDDTALAQHIWDLQDKAAKFDISWKLIAKAGEARIGSTTCRLCLKEAAEILKMDNTKLNKRREIIGKCRHVTKHFLSNWKSKREKELEKNRKKKKKRTD